MRGRKAGPDAVCLRDTGGRAPRGYYLQGVGDRGCMFALDIEEAMTFPTAAEARSFVISELPAYLDRLETIPHPGVKP